MLFKWLHLHTVQRRVLPRYTDTMLALQQHPKLLTVQHNIQRMLAMLQQLLFGQSDYLPAVRIFRQSLWIVQRYCACVFSMSRQILFSQFYFLHQLRSH